MQYDIQRVGHLNQFLHILLLFLGYIHYTQISGLRDHLLLIPGLNFVSEFIYGTIILDTAIARAVP